MFRFIFFLKIQMWTPSLPHRLVANRVMWKETTQQVVLETCFNIFHSAAPWLYKTWTSRWQHLTSFSSEKKTEEKQLRLNSGREVKRWHSPAYREMPSLWALQWWSMEKRTCKQWCKAFRQNCPPLPGPTPAWGVRKEREASPPLRCGCPTVTE